MTRTKNKKLTSTITPKIRRKRSLSSLSGSKFRSNRSKIEWKTYADFAFGFKHALRLHRFVGVLDILSVGDDQYDDSNNFLAIMLLMKNVEPQFCVFVKSHVCFANVWNVMKKQ